MPTYEVELSDGRIVDVEGDKEPTESDVMGLLSPQAAPVPQLAPPGQRPFPDNPDINEPSSGFEPGAYIPPGEKPPSLFQSFVPLPEPFQGKSLLGQAAAAGANFGIQTAGGMASPGGLMALPLGLLGKVGAVAAGAGFGVPAVKQGLERVYQGAALEQPQEVMEGALQAGTGGLITIGAAKALPRAASELTKTLKGANAEAIRSDTGLADEAGKTQEGSATDSGSDVQQTASGSPNAPRQETQVGVTPEVPLSEAPPSAVTGEANRTEAGESGAVEPPVVAGGTPQAMAEGGTPSETPQVGNVTQGVTEGVGEGLGGALAKGEITEGTGLKNAIGDKERSDLGYEEATPTQKQSMDTSWALADQALKVNPQAGDVIIQELKNDEGRGLTDVESATVLRHKVSVENALNDAAERTLTADTPEAKAIAEQEHATLSDKLLDILNVAKERGRQWGLEGRWRQAIAKEDFSLAKMEADARIKRGGRRLYDNELAEVKRLNEKLQTRIKELQSKQEKAAVVSQEKAATEATEEVARKAKTQPTPKSPDDEITDLKDKLKSKVEKEETESIQPLLERIATQLYHKGVREQGPMIDALHGIVKEFLPNITKLETLDALSGRGKFSLPNPEPVKAWLRDMKAQSRVAGHIEQLIKGDLKLPKTGPQRDVPTSAMRKIQNQLKDLMRKLGVRNTDPATQLASALSSAKTYTKNRIVDLQNAIAKKERLVRTTTPLKPDAELEGLRKTLTDTKAEYDQVFGKTELTDEQRIAIADKMLDRQINQLDEDLKAGRIDPVKKINKTPETPQLLEKRAWLKALQEYRQDLRDAKNPKLTPEERQLKMIKTRLASQTAKYQERLANGDFSTKKRVPPPEDREVQVARANLEQAKEDWQKNLTKAQMENSTVAQKAGNLISRWRREFVLSGIKSLFKLAGAAIQGLVLDPVQEAAGSAYSKAFPRFAERTKFEASSSVGIEAKAYAAAARHLLDDFGKTIKTGKSDLSYAYGGKGAIPEEMRAYFGSLHAAMKTPLMRQAWTRANEVLAKMSMEQGLDVTDPFVQMRLGTEAYKYAERKLFLEDNKLVSAYKRFLSTFEPSNRPQTKGEAVASTALRVALPIVKIPTNLVARTFNAAFGTFVGAPRLALAYAKGIQNLPPEAADSIARQLKAGSLGSALMLIGYYNADKFGGYYQPGEKRKPGEPKVGEVKIGGVTIPAWLQHRPEFMAAQMGATIYKVAHSRIKKTSTQQAGVTEGVLRSALGLVEQIPFIGEMFSSGRLRQSKDVSGAAQGYLAGLATPQLLREIAQKQDQDAKGELRKRDPHGMLQQLEVNLPYFRKKVPLKKTDTSIYK